jgi:hypothetical protein
MDPGSRGMPHHEFLWTARTIEKIEDNGLTVEEVEYSVLNAHESTKSNRSGQPAYIGELVDGRGVFVVYEKIDATKIAVVTAFKIYE